VRLVRQLWWWRSTFLLPLGLSFGLGTVIGLVLGVLAVFAVIGWQVSKITPSDYPTIRRGTCPHHSGRRLVLCHGLLPDEGATTVRFGDITDKTVRARVVVTIQMMLDVVIGGLVVRSSLNRGQRSDRFEE